jgi:ATP-dependent helicase HrpA
VPIPEVAEQVLARADPGGEPLLDAVGRGLRELRGVRVPPEAWDLARLPAHLR